MAGRDGSGYGTRFPMGVVPQSRPRRIQPLEESTPADVALVDVVDALYNQAVIADPEAFFLFGSSVEKPVTPGAATGVELYKNSLDVPVAVAVRAQMLETDTTVYLYIASDESRMAASTAPVLRQGASPRGGIVVPPGGALYGRMTAQDSNTDSRNLIVTSVPLKGLQLFNRGND